VTTSCLRVLRVLAAHPYDDTVAAIAIKSGLETDDVAVSLETLRHEHLTRRWESHWQLTSAGLVAAAA
jgi:DNA-binding IclR family transcriptional regulator